MQTVDETLALARQLRQAGQFDRAAEVCRQIVQARPGHVEAWSLLGMALFDTSQLQESLGALREAGRLSPQSAEIVPAMRAALAGHHNQRGLHLDEQGRLDDAAYGYREAPKADPCCAAAHGNPANILRRQGRFADAERAYWRVLDFAPDNAQAHNDLGYLARVQGRDIGAVHRYRRAIALDPQFAEAHEAPSCTWPARWARRCGWPRRFRPTGAGWSAGRTALGTRRCGCFAKPPGAIGRECSSGWPASWRDYASARGVIVRMRMLDCCRE